MRSISTPKCLLGRIAITSRIQFDTESAFKMFWNRDGGTGRFTTGSCGGTANQHIKHTRKQRLHCGGLRQGGKIHTIKSNATYTHGIYMNVVYESSSQTLMQHLDIENTTNSPIYIARGWPYITITGSYLYTLQPNIWAIYAPGLTVTISERTFWKLSVRILLRRWYWPGHKLALSGRIPSTPTSLPRLPCSAINTAQT